MTHKTLSRAFLAAASIAVLGCAAGAHAAAFTNGSFENASVDPAGGFTTLFNGSTAIDGWVVGGDSIDYIGGYWQAADGARSIDLSGNANGSVSQTFDTVAGHTYLVNFQLAGNPDGGLGAKLAISSADGGQQQSNIFNVTGSDSRANMNWANYSYQFTAATNSTTLSFASATGTAYGPALDNVSVGLAVPEPATWAMMMLGFGGLGATLRRARRSAAVTA